MIPVKIRQKVHIIDAWLTITLQSEHMYNMMPFTHWKTAENGQMSKLNEKKKSSGFQ